MRRITRFLCRSSVACNHLKKHGVTAIPGRVTPSDCLVHYNEPSCGEKASSPLRERSVAENTKYFLNSFSRSEKSYSIC